MILYSSIDKYQLCSQDNTDRAVDPRISTAPSMTQHHYNNNNKILLHQKQINLYQNSSTRM